MIIIVNYCSLSILHLVLRLLRHKGKHLFSPILKPLLITQCNGTFFWAVAANKPMAATELPQPMGGKPARMGGAYGYIMRAFAKAPQISSPSAITTRSFLYETRSLHRWTSHRKWSRPLSARPTRHFSAAAGPLIPCCYLTTLSYEDSYKRANFCGFIGNAGLFLSFVTPLHAADKHVSVFHAWAPPMLKQCSLRSNVTTAVTWVSSLRSWLAFFSESNPAPRVLPAWMTACHWRLQMLRS